MTLVDYQLISQTWQFLISTIGSFLPLHSLSNNKFFIVSLFSRVARRRRSYFAISLLWILSIIYVIIPTIGWSCADICSCLSSCFPEEDITDPPVAGCSRAFPPLSNSWIAVTIGMWAVGLTAVLIHLKRYVTRSLFRHRYTTAYRSRYVMNVAGVHRPAMRGLSPLFCKCKCSTMALYTGLGLGPWFNITQKQYNNTDEVLAIYC